MRNNPLILYSHHPNLYQSYCLLPFHVKCRGSKTHCFIHDHKTTARTSTGNYIHGLTRLCWISLFFSRESQMKSEGRGSSDQSVCYFFAINTDCLFLTSPPFRNSHTHGIADKASSCGDSNRSSLVSFEPDGSAATQRGLFQRHAASIGRPQVVLTF